MEQAQRGAAGKNGGRLTNAGMGRPRGVPNKATRTIKAMYLQALDKAGGWKFFHRLATGNAEDRRVFATIGARLFPLEVQGQIDASLTVRVVTLGGDIVRELPAGQLPAPSCIPGESEVVTESESGGSPRVFIGKHE